MANIPNKKTPKKSSANKNHAMLRAKGKTVPGTHVPVLTAEILASLSPAPGEIIVDCTLGFGAHTRQFIKKIGPTGKIIALDVDSAHIKKTQRRLSKLDADISYHNTNFANISEVLQNANLPAVDIIFADIGVSSMQIDDPSRGISYRADGPLDMRMDPSLEKTGVDLLATLTQQELSQALRELSDEPDHEMIATCIAGQRMATPIKTTSELTRLILNAKGLTDRTWKKQQKNSKFGGLHPAARTFQTLRILVNNELGSLEKLLQQAPSCLAPGGRIGVISFHSGEDRIVKRRFQQALADGIYKTISPNPLKPRTKEILSNPRSASAKFRYAIKK
jgi:16S rRNA (cytosine1402-N4)-methyltransferase